MEIPDEKITDFFGNPIEGNPSIGIHEDNI